MSKAVARRIVIPLVFVAFATLVVRALREVLRGNGAGVFQNVYGMWVHWVTVLTADHLGAGSSEVWRRISRGKEGVRKAQDEAEGVTV